MEQYSQHNLKAAASKPEHSVRKAEFDSVTNTIRDDLRTHNHADLAPKASPALSGVPTAPTATAGTNTTQLSTTAFVQTAIAGKANTSHTHTTVEVTGLDAALAGKATSTHTHTTAQITNLDTTLAAKANLASPALIGTPTAPTAGVSTNSTQIATTAFVKSQNYVPDQSDLGGGAGSATVRILYNVAALALPTSSPTGTVKITIPVTWNVAMFNIELSGFMYGGTAMGPWKMFLGGCNHSSGPAWQHCAAFTGGGRLPFSSVRFGHDGTNVCILLGTTASVWPYSGLSIDKVYASYSGAAVTPKAGWKIELITSETGISNIVTATINDSMALNGVPTAPTAAGTVNNTQIATTAFVQALAATKAASSHTHTTAQVANLDTTLAAKANLASPTLTGTPTAPTAASTVNSTQIATTAFVKSLLTSNNLQFKLMTFSTLNTTYVSIGVTPKLIVATFYSTFTSGENDYRAGYVQFWLNGTTSYLQTEHCSSVYNPGSLQVSGTTVRTTGWWSTVALLIFY